MTIPSVICRYCRRVPGVGPIVVKPPATPFDQVYAVGPDAVLVPTFGMFVPGYFLVVSTRHVLSFSEYEGSALDALSAFVSSTISELSPIFGEYLVFEHGPSAVEAASHGGCISHAHLHLIPVAAEVESPLLEELAWEPIAALRDLATLDGAAYALCALRNNYYVSESSTPGSQWIRRKIVEWMKLPKDWNWATYAGEAELATTLKRLVTFRLSIHTSAMGSKDEHESGGTEEADE